MRRKASLFFYLFATMLVVLGWQACGEFTTPYQMSSTPVAGVAGNQMSIQSSASTLAVNQSLSFTANGPTPPTSARTSWSHFMVATGSSTISTCTELAGNSSPTYQIRCTGAGLLTVQVSIVNGTTNWGSATYQAGVGTSITPSPSSTPNPLGVTLYMQNCQSCHFALNANNIGDRTAAGISSAIGSVGQMRGLSSLSQAQILAISSALLGR